MSPDDLWQPRCRPPIGLIRPVRSDPEGLRGPRPSTARGPHWLRTPLGLVVPADAPASVEQRIMNAATGLPPGCLVTGWAALRLFGGGFFDGFDSQRRLLPVAILVPHRRRVVARPGLTVLRDRHPPTAVSSFSIACAPPERAVLDQMRTSANEREAAVALDMALAARLTTLDSLRSAVSAEPRRVGIGHVHKALTLASPLSRSPQETHFRMIWELDAGRPRPLVNQPVRDRSGRLVGIADLFDPVAGVAGEYDGALHRDRSRHRRDVERHELFRAHRIEVVTMVAGDRVQVVVQRIRAAYDRALWLPEADRTWTASTGEQGLPSGEDSC